MPRLNYDDIAHLYDEPSRDHSVDPHLIAFLVERCSSGPIRLLDIGCGTGKQLAANKARYPHLTMIGVDRFEGMLRVAHTRDAGIGWTRADGCALPFSSGVFDYVTCQFAYPHIGTVHNLLSEVFRVVRPRGRFVMTNIDPWAMPNWILYRFFPTAYELDKRDFVPADEFVRRMTTVGFGAVTTNRTDQSRIEEPKDFLTFVRQRHRASQLMAIPDSDYERGLNELEQWINGTRSEQNIRSEFVLLTIAGDKIN